MSNNTEETILTQQIFATELAQLNAERKEIMAMLGIHLNNLTSFQNKIYDKFKQLNLNNDAFYDFNRFEEHIQLSQYISDNMTFTNLQDVCTRWNNLFLKVLRLKPRCHAFFVPVPKMAAAFCILDGQYYKAVTLLYNAVQLRPYDMSSWFSLLWWIVFLQDWKMLGFLLRREMDIMKEALRGDGYSIFIECCWLIYRMHVKESLEVAKEIVAKLQTISSSDKRTYMYSSCKIMLRNCLVHASRVSLIDLSEIGDPLSNRNSALEICDLILHSRLPQFAKQTEPISDFLQQKLHTNDDFVNADECLRIFSTVADYFELSQICADEMLEVGLVRESDSFCLTSWKHALLFALPYRVLISLSHVIYVRSVTTLERNLLDKYCACLNALITPSEVFQQNVLSAPKKVLRSSSQCRSMDEDYSFIIENISNKIENCNISEESRLTKISLTIHVKACKCVLCRLNNMDQNALNWRFHLQIAWILLIISDFHCNEFENFRRKCVTVKTIIGKERSTLYRVIMASDSQEFLTPHFSELWIQAASCVLLHENASKLSDLLKESYTEEALELCKHSPLRFRGYFLLFKLLRNESSFYQFISTLKQHASEAILPQTSCILTSTSKSNSESIRKEIHEAYLDQKQYGHLFFREWRQRNCLFLGRNLDIIAHKALFFLEVATPAVRQCARLCQHEKLQIPLNVSLSENITQSTAPNFYFKDTTEFMTFIRSLPDDITLVNLVVDNLDTLWLIRCHSSHDPIVLPVTNVCKDDKILKRMRDILEANNDSLNSKSEPELFWKSRRQLDADVKQLISDWQKTWFGGLALLLTPLGYGFSAQSLQNLQKIGSKFEKTFKFSKSLATTLVRLCDHASKEEWEELVKHLTMDSSEQATFSNIFKYYDIIHGNITHSERVRSSKKYTLLIVPPQLNFLPWECLSIFERTPLVSRIPSIHFFDYLANKSKMIPKEVDGRNSYYVLNPGGDLANTEKRISVFVEKYKWNGVIGKVPSKTEIKNVLAEHDLFLYLGHGSGGRYFGRSSIRQSDCKAVSVLMGCSSGCIQDLGPTFDGKGTIYEYLIAKCPCLVGCLWTVTDGEIDRFFIALMEYCFNKTKLNASKNLSIETLENSVGTPILSALPTLTPTSRLASRTTAKVVVASTPKSGGRSRNRANKENEKLVRDNFDDYRILVEGVTHARKACKLPFLTGASVVSYGLPIISRFSETDPISPIVID